MATPIGLRKARATLSTLVDEVAAGGRFVVTVHDRPRAALVPIEDLAKIEAGDAKPRRPKRRKPASA